MAILRRLLLLGLLVTAGLCSGCDLGSLMYFLSPEAKTDAEVRKLAADDGKTENRVVILVSRRGTEMRPELIQADRSLQDFLCTKLKEQCAENNERLAIVAPRKVEEFKSTHPHWQAMDPREIGKHFNADYVVDLEINSISMYAKGGNHEMFQGNAEISLTLFNIKDPDSQVDQRELTFTYPHEARQGMTRFETTESQFRQNFLNYMAKHLAWNFTGHPPVQDRMSDD